MGASVGLTVAKTTTESITSVTQKQVQQATSRAFQSNMINIDSGGGDVIIDGNVNQDNESTVNMKQVAGALTSSSIQNQLSAKMKQAALATNKDFNIFQLSVAASITDNVQRTTSKLSSDIQQSCAVAASQENSFNVKSNGGTVTIGPTGSINQGNRGKLEANCAQSAVSKSSALSQIQTQIDQSAAAKNTGVNIEIIMVAIIAGAVVLALSGPAVVKDILEPKHLLPIVAIVCCGVSLGMYFGGVGASAETQPDMRNFAYAKMCAGATGKYAGNQAGSADEAVENCRKDTNCKGVQYAGGGKTTYYKNVPTNCSSDIKISAPREVWPTGVRVACSQCNNADQFWTGHRTTISKLSKKDCEAKKTNSNCSMTCDPSTFKPGDNVLKNSNGVRINIPSWSDEGRGQCDGCNTGDVLSAKYSKVNGKDVCTITTACDGCALKKEDNEACTMCNTGLAHMICSTNKGDSASGVDTCPKIHSGDTDVERGSAKLTAAALKGKMIRVPPAKNNMLWIWFGAVGVPAVCFVMWGVMLYLQWRKAGSTQ